MGVTDSDSEGGSELALWEAGKDEWENKTAEGRKVGVEGE